MDFLKKLFSGGGSSGTSGDSRGIYFYVRPKGCEEVVRVRIDRNNDLSLSDDGKNHWVHKVVMGSKCFQRAELDVYFNSNRQMTSSEVSGGDLVKQADYDAWVASQQAQT
jgi:hypothetical protein